MTATAVRSEPARAVSDSHRVTFLGALKSEWIKLFAVRSTPWVLIVSIVAMVGFSAMMAAGFALAGDEGFSDDPSVGTSVATFGYGVGQIVFIVLGAMRITGEYSTGQIRSTLSAVPRRIPVLVAKAVVVAVTSFVTGAVSVALALLVTTPILNQYGLAADLSDPVAQRALLGTALYLTAVALMALGVGFLLRHTAGAIFAMIGLFVILPILSAVPIDWVQDALQFLPAAAGERLILAGSSLSEMPGMPEAILSPWAGYGVMLLWTAAILGAAAVVLRRRDA